MEAYQDFAYVYDTLMDDTPYDMWAERVCQAVEKYGMAAGDAALVDDTTAAGGAGDDAYDAMAADTADSELDAADTANHRQSHTMVDLGCGTGTLTMLLATRGYDMIGVDLSEDMLAVAMDKLIDARDVSSITYTQQDMRALQLPYPVPTIISVCDSINYLLSEANVLQTFRQVYESLLPGGLFIFDFNTTYKYRGIIGDTTIAESLEDCAFIWENFYDEESGINEYDITFFVKESVGASQAYDPADADTSDVYDTSDAYDLEEHTTFRRFFETHQQKGYTFDEISRLLQQAGFSIREAADGDEDAPIHAASQRIFIIAQK